MTRSAIILRNNPARVGQWGESVARVVLEQAGYTCLAKNWRAPAELGKERPTGELDLVMVDPDCVLVVIEVKTRSGEGFGHPLEAITGEKAGRLRQLAYTWAQLHPGDFRGLRVDAVAICGNPARFDFEHRQAVV